MTSDAMEESAGQASELGDEARGVVVVRTDCLQFQVEEALRVQHGCLGFGFATGVAKVVPPDCD